MTQVMKLRLLEDKLVTELARVTTYAQDVSPAGGKRTVANRVAVEALNAVLNALNDTYTDFDGRRFLERIQVQTKLNLDRHGRG